jgi:hypothetical protein
MPIGRSKMESWSALAIGLVSVATAACASPVSNHSPVTDSSISPNGMAVYDAVLASWLGREQSRQFGNEQLSAPPSKNDPEIIECTKGLNFSVAPQAVQVKKSLAGVRFKRNGIELIDGSQWKPADPGQGVANGKSVEAAVSEGFSKSLISFSQVAFSRDGEDALVKFGMVCGSLCGSGSTIHLHKSATGWAVLTRCGGWIS